MEIKGMTVMKDAAVDAAAEKTLEGEIVIPDYLGDAARVIKAECRPRIISKKVSEGRLSVDCGAEICVWYWSEDSAVRVLRKNEEFYEEFTLDGAEKAVCLRTAVRTEFVNGYAVNSRKIGYKAVVAVSARCSVKKAVSLFSPEGQTAFECDPELLEISDLAASAEKNVSVSDVIELSQGRGEIKEIIKSDATVFTTEMKSITNKIITRGKAETKVIYLTPDGNIESVAADIPFTQIIDISGMDESSTADLRYTVNSVTASPRADENGNMCRISVELDLTVLARGYRNVKAQAAVDAFSPAYAYELKKEKLCYERFDGSVELTASDRGFAETSETVAAVSDASGTAVITGVRREGDRVTVGCAVNCAVIVKNSAGEPVALSRRFETSVSFEADPAAESIRLEPEAKLVSLSYSITDDGRIDVRYEVAVNALVFTSFSTEVVVSAEADEGTPYVRKNKAPLVIYYAKKGDRIFDIAKSYRASLKAVSDANGIADGRISADRTVIIPIIKQ